MLLGDIFKDNLPAVELFSFAHICMYLDDEGLLGLLARVYEALPPGKLSLQVISLFFPNKYNIDWKCMHSNAPTIRF